MTEKASCTQQRYDIHHSDLPLSCPTADMATWDAHPKVYLDIEAKSEVACPYCGTVYVLVEQ